MSGKTQVSAGALDGKVALVTGGAGGIGSATARFLAARGAQVVATDLRQDALDDLVEHLGQGDAGHRHDVSNDDDWQRVRTAVLERYGRIDIPVNNAAIAKPTTVLDIELADWDRIVGIDQTGVLLGMKTVGRAMTEQGSGSIINMSS